jgi:hypothetical protein
MDEKKLIILVQGHECLYNLLHKDYDNNLLKHTRSSWKEIAGELHAQDKELSRRTQPCRRVAGKRHGVKAPFERVSAALLSGSSNRLISKTVRYYFRSATVKVMAVLTLSAAAISVSTRRAAAILCRAVRREAM